MMLPAFDGIEITERGMAVLRVAAEVFGPPEDLQVQEVEDLQPGPGQAVVEMRAGVVSFVNSLLVRGAYQVRPPLPFVPGTSGVGEIRRVGPGFDEAWIGRRVAITQLSGGLLASQAVVTREAIAEMPDGVADVEAAAALEATSTMHFALTMRYAVTSGSRILVLGAGGAIGRAAVDVARALGARVIAAASSRARLAWADGVDGVDLVDLAETDLKSALDAVAPDGVDAVVDPVGGAASQIALKSLTAYGTYLVLGFASGDIPRLGANRVLIANKTVVGVDMGHAIGLDAGLAERIMTEVLAAVKSGRYSPPVPYVCSLEDVPSVLTAIEKGGQNKIFVATPSSMKPIER